MSVKLSEHILYYFLIAFYNCLPFPKSIEFTKVKYIYILHVTNVTTHQ